jgi:tyrosine-protein kinase Etk/Wzc
MKPSNFEESLLMTSEGASSAPNREHEISLLDFLLVVSRRRKFIGLSTLIVCVVTLIATFVIPAFYTATTSVVPPQQGSSMAAALLAQMGSSSSSGGSGGGGAASGLASSLLGGIKNPADMSIALLKSRTVEDAIVRRFELMKLYNKKHQSDARKKLEDRTSIENNAKEGIIKISVEDHSPERAAQLTNAYVEEFKRLSANLAVTEAGQRRIFFEQQLEEAKNNLAGAEEAMKGYQENGGLIQLDSQSKALIESVTRLKAEIVAKEVQIRSMSMSETNNNPDLVLAREQLRALQSQLKQLGGSESIDSDLIVPRGQIPSAGLGYVRRLREVKYRELIFELMAKQFELAKLDEAREGAVIQVVDPAVPPDKKSFPKASFFVPLAAALWLLFAFLGLFFQHGVRRANSNPGDREKLQELRALWRRNPMNG